MTNKPLLIIMTTVLLVFVSLSGCQEQQNQNGNQTDNSTNGNQQHNTTINRFLGDWDAIDVAPEYESWTFYANHTVKNDLIQIFEGQPLPSTSWFNYSYDASTLCFTAGVSPGSPDYMSICYSYEFSQNATRLTLSSNSIVIIDLVKIVLE